MKRQFPICFTSAVLCLLSYIVFSVAAYSKYPLPFSPGSNWLSDLGNQLVNPQGAIFYSIGVSLSAIFLAIWFTLGLAEWKLKDNKIQHTLLLVSQIAGVLTSFALVMSAVYPINHLKTHAFWSDLNFILFGISFAFSVAALRHHSSVPRLLLIVGGIAAVLPTLFLSLNHVYWLEWLAISIFLIYILSIGIASLVTGLRSPAHGDLTFQKVP